MFVNNKFRESYIKRMAEQYAPPKTSVLLGEDDDYFENYNTVRKVYWNLEYPHLAVVGNSGSGKTTALKSILVHISRTPELSAELYLLNYKGFDFRFAKDSDRYYSLDQCKTGIESVYSIFLKRWNGEDKSNNWIFVVFDEYSSFCNSITDKKILESIKQKVGNLLAMGRAFRISCIFCQQRADAEYFRNRDCLNAVIGFSNISKESKQMLFDEVKDLMHPIDRVYGTAYFRQGSTLTLVNFTQYPDAVVEESIMDLI